MRRRIAAAVVGILVTLSAAPPSRAGDAIFGWWGSAEVRVPGRGVKVVVVKGVITAPNAATALAIGKLHGTNQAAQFGDIAVGPAVQLISPFFVPSIQAGIREDLRPGGG